MNDLLLRIRRFHLVCLLALAFAAPLLSQSNQGAIAGTVLDSSSASVAGAEVTATSQETGVKYSAVTSASGSYRFPEVRVGTYDVTVTATGFKRAARTGLTVQINTVTPLDIALATGGIEETVSVTADAPGVQTQTSDIGTVVTPKQVLDLPLALGGVGALRSPEAFVFLTPGTAGPGSGSSDSGSANAGSNNNVFQSKIAGGQNYATEILVDGASVIQAVNGSAFDETSPSVEAIQEFKVLTTSIPAEFGRTTGGVESFTTKGGGNLYHGSIFEIFRNEVLNANTWFNNGYLAQDPHSPIFQRPADKKNDYGVSLGGPVTVPHVYSGRDRSFFFFSWEQYKQQQGGTVTSTVPSLGNRAGDFSATLDPSVILGVNPCTGSPIYQGQIFDPLTTRMVGGVTCRDPFLNNAIGPDRFSAVARNVLQYLNAAQPINNALQQNYAFNTTYPITNTTYTIRIDQSIGTHDKIFSSYSSRDNTRRNGSPVLPEPLNNCCQAQNFTSHFARFGWDHSFNQSVLNHLNLGYNRPNSKNYSVVLADNKNYPQLLGIGNVSALTFPSFFFGEGLDNIGFSNNDDLIENGARLADSIIWTHARHSFKFGVDYRFQQQNAIANDNAGGNFNFGRGQTAATASSTNLSGNGFASFLLGETNSASLDVNYHQPKWIYEYAAGFVQDDWQVDRSLVLNLGVRWDVDLPRHEASDLSSNFDPTTPNPGASGRLGALVFAGSGPGRSGRSSRWADVWYKDFAPRVGFAWKPYVGNDKLVVRGGGSIVYAPLTYSDFGGSLLTGYRASESPSSVDGFSPAFNIDTGFPAFAPPPNLDPAQSNDQNVNYVAKSYGRPGMVQGWSLEVEQELAPDLIFSLGYIGQHSTHLRSNLAFVNNLDPRFYGLGTTLLQSASTNSAGIKVPYAGFAGTVGQALRPFPQYRSVNSGALIENLGQASYNALYVKVERRFRSGLNLLSSYTWSKSITDADSALPPLESASGIQNPFNLRGEKSISIQDIPNVFVLSYLYELPFGKDKPFVRGGVGGAVLGGWQIGGIQRYQSGQPISFGCATAAPATNTCFRFNRAGNGSLLSNAAQHGSFNPFTDVYFNPSTFVDPNSAASIAQRGYTFGDLPRVTGEVRMPHFDNEDFSIIRNFPVFERVHFQLRGELLNAFNRHVFNRPANNPNTLNFGQVTSTLNAPRNVQFQGRIVF